MRFVLAVVYTLITLTLGNRLAFALDPANRVLVPAKGRAPAEAGLESGRYEELSAEELAQWEKKREKELTQDQKPQGQDFREPASRPKL